MESMEGTSWDRWHLFPGVDPDLGENPDNGDKVEIEYQSMRRSAVPGSPENTSQTASFLWTGRTPKKLRIGYVLKRWRHLDHDQAKAWQAWRDIHDQRRQH